MPPSPDPAAAPSGTGPAPSGAGSASAAPSRSSWLRGLAPFLRAHAGKAAVAIAATLVGQAGNVVVPLIQKVIVDEAIVAGTAPLLPWIGAMLAAAAIAAIATVIRRRNGNTFGFAVQHDLRAAVFRHVQALDVGYGGRLPGGAALTTGEVIARSTADITLIQTLFSQLHVLLGSLVMVVAAVALMLALSPLLGLVVVATLPVLWISARRLRHDLFPAVWSDQQAQARLHGLIEETTTGVRVVRAFGQERRETGRFTAAAETLFASRLRTAGINAAHAPVLQVVPGVAQLAVLGVGAWLVWSDAITIGTVLAFFAYLVQLVAPVRTLTGALTTIEQARTGAERVLDLLAARPAVVEAHDAVPLAVPRGEVAFEAVTVDFGGARPALSAADLTIRPGETVAIVGASGSGKSTLALLVARLNDPAAGRVRIDGTDIRTVTLASLRRAVGTVFEDPFLYAGTVADNIARARPEAGRDEIEAAARTAGADEFIRLLPNGYDTPVAELGATLSGGQRQRLTIARTILAAPPILVLDDATSAVDARTEAAILDALAGGAAGRTTLVVARRRSTLARADRIVVLDDGRIADVGTHDDLDARSVLYRRLFAWDLVDDGRPELADAPAGPDGIEAAAWPDAPAAEGPSAAPRFTESVSAGGHSRRTGPAAAAIATAGADVAARLAALPPATARPAVDVAAETRPVDGFTPAGFLRPYGAGLLAGLALVAADTLLGLAGPALIGHGVDAIAAADGPALAAYAGAYAAVLAVTLVVARSIVLTTSGTAERLLFALRLRIFAKLQRLPIERYETESAGRIMARATTDVDVLAGLLQQGLLVAVVGLASCAGILVVLATWEPHLAVALALVLPAILIATEWYRRASARAYEGSRRQVAAVYAGLQEGVAAARTTRSIGAESRTADRFAADSARYREARVRAATISAYYFPFLQFVTVVAKALVLAAAAGPVAAGGIGLGVVAGFLVYLDQFFAPVQQLSQVFDQWFQAGTSVRRIRALLDEPSGTPEAADPLPLPIAPGALRFDGVTFHYPGADRPALDGIDLVIPAGQHVAIVGRTGAGKSTLARLALRFSDPSAGRVLLAGVPLDRTSTADLRRAVAVVPQEPVLFAASIADNIAYGRPGATPAAIEAAARLAGAHRFIRRLPHGYRTPVAERGRSLSAGERQLLCLARALLVDPALLVLDEATAQVDREADEAVRRAIEAGAGRRTTLVIAHRLETALRADRVVVLDAGRIVDDGAPADLLARDGPFRRLNALADLDAWGPLLEPGMRRPDPIAIP